MKKILILLLCLGFMQLFAAKIALVGAMDVEIKNLLSIMKEQKLMQRAGFSFYEGEILGKEVVVFKSGVGKVNAAMSTTIALENYNIEKIIFTGVAGSLDEKIKVLDIVISKDLVQHDFKNYRKDKNTKMGLAPGSINGKYYASDSLVEMAKKAAIKVLGKERVFVGTIATGDEFVANAKRVKDIVRDFGALAVEMEGAALAHVATLYKKDFVVIRAMSDMADGKARKTYNNFLQEAADEAVKIIEEILKSE